MCVHRFSHSFWRWKTKKRNKRVQRKPWMLQIRLLRKQLRSTRAQSPVPRCFVAMLRADLHRSALVGSMVLSNDLKRSKRQRVGTPLRPIVCHLLHHRIHHLLLRIHHLRHRCCINRCANNHPHPHPHHSIHHRRQLSNAPGDSISSPCPNSTHESSNTTKHPPVTPQA